MKRTELKRRTPLRSTGRLRRLPKSRPTASQAEARMAWKDPKAGFCGCGCQRFSLHLERHHVCYEQHVRAENGDVWCLANSLLLHPACHAAHHSGQRRIRIEYIPAAALAFAVDLFGEARAAVYVRRYYDCTVTL